MQEIHGCFAQAVYAWAINVYIHSYATSNKTQIKVEGELHSLGKLTVLHKPTQ